MKARNKSRNFKRVRPKRINSRQFDAGVLKLLKWVDLCQEVIGPVLTA